MTAPAQRVEALEAEAFRTSRQLSRIEAGLSHLTDGLDTLSADQREFRHIVIERLDRVDEKLARVDARLDRVDEKLAQVDVIAQEQTRQAGVLAAIARKLGVEDQGDEHAAT